MSVTGFNRIKTAKRFLNFVLHRRYEDFWPVGRVMMAFLAAQGTVFSVQKYALADVDLHVAVGCLGALAGASAKGALRVRQLDDSLPGAHGAVFCLHRKAYH